jgi:hypothetical protein
MQKLFVAFSLTGIVSFSFSIYLSLFGRTPSSLLWSLLLGGLGAFALLFICLLNKQNKKEIKNF